MASLNDILAALQNGVSAVNKLTSSQVTAFGLVQTSSGGSYRIALLQST